MTNPSISDQLRFSDAEDRILAQFEGDQDIYDYIQWLTVGADMTVEEYEEEISYLNRELNYAEKEIEDAEDEVDSLEGKISDLYHEISTLEATIEELEDKIEVLTETED